jgi:hypothetical protein
MIRKRRPAKNKLYGKLVHILTTLWVCPPTKNKILATENKSYDNMGNTKKYLNIKGWERVCQNLDNY